MAFPKSKVPVVALLVSMTAAVEATWTRFHQWFPDSAEWFADVSSETCNATLRAFESAYESQSSTYCCAASDGQTPGQPAPLAVFLFHPDRSFLSS